MQARICQCFCLLELALVHMVHSLSVSPPLVTELEDHSEVSFFCREDGVFATDIVWQDPLGNFYTPGSTENENTRITAEGSRLSIFNIIRNDAGTYRCLNSNNHTDFADGRLIVNAPPRFLSQIPLQYIFKGNTSLIKCEVDRGIPLAAIRWLRMTNVPQPLEITSNYDPRFRIVENGLEISNVQLSDEGTYRCYVYNEHGTEILHIDAVFKDPPRILNPMPVQDIYKGNTSLIKCKVNRGHPLADIQWLHVNINNETGEEELSEITSNYNPRFKIVENGLEISNVEFSDEGTYRCYLNNSFTTDILDVRATFKDPPRILDPNPVQDIYKGNTSLIKCKVNRGYPLADIQWLHVKINSETGEEELSKITSDYNPRFKIVENGLEISNVEFSDEGTYRCYLSNSFSTDILDVRATFKAPLYPTFKNYSYTIELNRQVVLNCSIDAVPRPEFQWMLANTEDHLPSSSWNSISHANETTTSTLKYTFGTVDLDENCRIHVLCIATTDYGRSEEHFTLSLNSSKSCYVEPESPLSPSVASIDDRSSSNKFLNTSTIVVMGVIVVIFLVLAILAVAFCFIYFKNKKAKDMKVPMGDNPAYETVKCRAPQDNKPHLYEFVPM